MKYFLTGVTFLLAAMAFAAQPKRGEPSRQVPGGVMVVVPYRLDHYASEQRFEVLTMELGPLPRET